MDGISTIESSLTNLENALAPLFETTLSETEAQLDTLQRAKLQIHLPYVIHNLLYSYLRWRDVDTANHAATSELERIVQYFSKLRNIENPEKRTLVVDQEAATRFIKHAIKDAISGEIQETQARCIATESSISTASVAIESKTTIQSTSIQATSAQPSHAALAKIEERLKASTISYSQQSDDELMIVDEDNASCSKIEGKRKAREGRRRGMDPWAGFEDSITSAKIHPVANTGQAATINTARIHSASHVASVLPTTKHVKERKPRAKKKKQLKDIEVIDVDTESGCVGNNSQRSQLANPQRNLPISSFNNTVDQNMRKKKQRKEPKDVSSPIIISD